MDVLWSPSELREVMRIYDYLNDCNPKDAAKVFTNLIATGDSLENLPYRGRQVHDSEMREILTAYPYIIRYRVTRDAVRNLRVRHTARRPTSP